jgi:hypothetical protein
VRLARRMHRRLRRARVGRKAPPSWSATGR